MANASIKAAFERMWQHITLALSEKFNKTDIIPIENGGTGASDIAEALSNLGGANITKLWENASPTSNFAAQTVNLRDDLEYEALLITACYSKSYIRIANTIMVDLNADNTNGLLNVMWQTNTARLVDITVSGTGNIAVDFQNGYYYSSYGATQTANAQYCVPLAIYGVKGVQ